MPKPKQPQTFPINLTQDQIAHTLIAVKAYQQSGECVADELLEVVAEMGEALAMINLMN